MWWTCTSFLVGNPDALIGKFRFILAWLRKWSGIELRNFWNRILFDYFLHMKVRYDFLLKISRAPRFLVRFPLSLQLWPRPRILAGRRRLRYILYSPSHSAIKPWRVCVPSLVRVFWTFPTISSFLCPLVQAPNKKWSEPDLESAKQRLTWIYRARLFFLLLSTLSSLFWLLLLDRSTISSLKSRPVKDTSWSSTLNLDDWLWDKSDFCFRRFRGQNSLRPVSGHHRFFHLLTSQRSQVSSTPDYKVPKHFVLNIPRARM